MRINLKMTTYKLFLVLGAFSLVSSCTWPKESKERNQSGKAVSIGETVAGIDQNALIIFQDSKNNFWFGGNKKGVYKYDGQSLVLFTEKDGLIGHDVLGIQEDRFGNIYFDATKGVSRFDGQRFTTLEIMEKSTGNNEWKSEPDDLWFRMGWNSGGPYRFDGKNLYPLVLPRNEMENEFTSRNPNVSYNPYGIYHIYKDSKANIWFGTSNLGVYKYDGNAISWMYEKHLTETPEGGSFGIRSIIEDNDGFIWICNPKYKYRILPDNSTTNDLKPINYQREPGIESTLSEGLYFMSMTLDNDGDLWMATYDNGVWRNNGKELIHYPIKDGDTEVLLFSIYKDNQGALWLGTHNAGVYKYNGELFEKFEFSNHMR